MKSLSVKLGVILIGLTILGYGCPVVNAEGVWVVWSYTTSCDFKIMPSYWTMGEAFPTYKKCRDDIGATIFEIRVRNAIEKPELPGFEVTDSKITGHGEDWVSFKFKIDSRECLWTYKLYCYPDTIDPRK